MTTQYNDLITLGQDKKLIAATEVGSAPFPDLLQAYEAHWLYFCVWSDGFINNTEWNSVDDLKKVSSTANPRLRRGRPVVLTSELIDLRERVCPHS